MSTAATAEDTTPGRPRLRHARIIASQLPGMSDASRPQTTPASLSDTTSDAAGLLYVHPSPETSPAVTVTVTAVVASQWSVPSDFRARSGKRVDAGMDRVDGGLGRHRLGRLTWSPEARCSPSRAASAMIVSAGLADPWVGSTLPSAR